MRRKPFRRVPGMAGMEIMILMRIDDLPRDTILVPFRDLDIATEV